MEEETLKGDREELEQEFEDYNLNYWQKLAKSNENKKKYKAVNGRIYNRNDNSYYLALLEK